MSNERNSIEVEAARVIGDGDIIIRLKSAYRDDSISEMEKELSEKFGRKVILLDARFGEILVVPPKNCPVGGSQVP